MPRIEPIILHRGGGGAKPWANVATDVGPCPPMSADSLGLSRLAILLLRTIPKSPKTVHCPGGFIAMPRIGPIIFHRGEGGAKPWANVAPDVGQWEPLASCRVRHWQMSPPCGVHVLRIPKVGIDFGADVRPCRAQCCPNAAPMSYDCLSKETDQGPCRSVEKAMFGAL